MCKLYRSSELEGEEGSVVGQNTRGNFEQVDESFPLTREAVNDVLVVVRDRSLKEERQVGEDGTHLLAVDLHPGEELGKHDHIVHKWNGKQRILTDVVSRNSVDTAHEDLRRVFIESTLRVTHEGNILDHNLVVNLVLTFGVKSLVASNSIVEDTCLRDLLGPEGLIFR
jgi:hypothetical protein